MGVRRYPGIFANWDCAFRIGETAYCNCLLRVFFFSWFFFFLCLPRDIMEGVREAIIYEDLIFSKFTTNYLTEFPISDSVCERSTVFKKDLHKFPKTIHPLSRELPCQLNSIPSPSFESAWICTWRNSLLTRQGTGFWYLFFTVEWQPWNLVNNGQ